MGVVVHEARKIYHTWGRFVRALDGLNLDAETGQVTLIVGTNGSGKSTLLRAISGSLRLDSGDVLIDGSYRPSIGRKEVGMLQQVPVANLCPSFTIEEMIRLYLDGHSVDSWKGARTAFQDHGMAVNSRIREMSGGQQQLIALELVLARLPSILLLDEPTASLDPGHSERILARVAKAASEGVTVLLVSHNLEHGLSICDKVVLMHEGRVVNSWAGSIARSLTARDLKQCLVECAASSLEG